mmetsp:Transcript_24188/g.55203  ORF Transcript_24188/g.55203 Transcript_24188/m.55203 type:complete len:489 (-) Transcript_24188:205-1671(-)
MSVESDVFPFCDHGVKRCPKCTCAHESRMSVESDVFSMLDEVVVISPVIQRNLVLDVPSLQLPSDSCNTWPAEVWATPAARPGTGAAGRADSGRAGVESMSRPSESMSARTGRSILRGGAELLVPRAEFQAAVENAHLLSKPKRRQAAPLTLDRVLKRPDPFNLRSAKGVLNKKAFAERNRLTRQWEWCQARGGKPQDKGFCSVGCSKQDVDAMLRVAHELAEENGPSDAKKVRVSQLRDVMAGFGMMFECAVVLGDHMGTEVTVLEFCDIVRRIVEVSVGRNGLRLEPGDIARMLCQGKRIRAKSLETRRKFVLAAVAKPFKTNIPDALSTSVLHGLASALPDADREALMQQPFRRLARQWRVEDLDELDTELEESIRGLHEMMFPHRIRDSAGWSEASEGGTGVEMELDSPVRRRVHDLAGQGWATAARCEELKQQAMQNPGPPRGFTPRQPSEVDWSTTDISPFAWPSKVTATPAHERLAAVFDD